MISLNEVVGDWISENVVVDKTGVAMLPKSEFSTIREELQLRVLDRLVKIAGGQRVGSVFQNYLGLVCIFYRWEPKNLGLAVRLSMGG